MATENEPRVIKRYANRKLYDMRESCYITHDEIATLVKGGEDVKIIVGGAPVTQEFADDMGADGYGKDALDCVALAKTLMAELRA